jgi:hypothetical protein
LKIASEDLNQIEYRILDCVIPAWSAGIPADMDVSGRILRTWMPAIRAGMTRSSFSCFLGERKLKAPFSLISPR